VKSRLLFAGVLTLGALATLGAAAPRLGAQQSTPPVPPPAQPAPKRRAIDIRGQAPAPEVVTVRPREIPQYSRRIVSPALITAPPVQRPSSTVVILPIAPDVNPVTPKPR
jgi:hypothetical protein